MDKGNSKPNKMGTIKGVLVIIVPALLMWLIK